MEQYCSLSVRDLNKRFGRFSSDVWALRDVSFSLPKGTLTGVLGHNGAGKTTLLGSLCGSVKPTSGTILFFRKRNIPCSRAETSMRVYAAATCPFARGHSCRGFMLRSRHAWHISSSCGSPNE